ncbi:MAG: GguC protein [Bacteroidetes bacterium]|nr:GguC protein [Bacteroidota bacterium]
MKETIRLVQIVNPAVGRKVALVKEPALVLLEGVSSVYELAVEALQLRTGLPAIVERHLGGDELDYNAVYGGLTGWSMLPSFDCPQNQSNCLVSGTGLTHKNSALNRQVMHQAENTTLTDSMRIYQWGIEGGRARRGAVGVQPEWFYKGNGNVLKGHGQPLSVPVYANDGGEEPEVAAVYLVDQQGQPYRIGFTPANEFSDHVMEKKNYLYLAPSKLRNCSIGPELVIDMEFMNVEGSVTVYRQGEELWSSTVHTGEDNMAHSLANLEHHHFKYKEHRLPLQAHVHFFGADAFSYGGGVLLEDGDETKVYWQGMGRALVNPVDVEAGEETLIEVRPLL